MKSSWKVLLFTVFAVVFAVSLGAQTPYESWPRPKNNQIRTVCETCSDFFSLKELAEKADVIVTGTAAFTNLRYKTEPKYEEYLRLTLDVTPKSLLKGSLRSSRGKVTIDIDLDLVTPGIIRRGEKFLFFLKREPDGQFTFVGYGSGFFHEPRAYAREYPNPTENMEGNWKLWTGKNLWESLPNKERRDVEVEMMNLNIPRTERDKYLALGDTNDSRGPLPLELIVAATRAMLGQKY